MAAGVELGDAEGMKAVDLRPVVRTRQGRLGRLDAVMWRQRLLRLHAPQVAGGTLLVPFEAVERVDLNAREIHLRPAREALALAAHEPSEESREAERDRLSSSSSDGND